MSFKNQKIKGIKIYSCMCVLEFLSFICKSLYFYSQLQMMPRISLTISDAVILF